MDYSMNQRVGSTLGNRDPDHSPQGVYRCRGDDSWLAITCTDDSEFAALCEIIGRPQLAKDGRFADTHRRFKNHDELDVAIGAWTATQDHYEAFHTLQRAGVTAAPVLTAAEVFADPHLRARDNWQRVRHPKAGEHWYYKTPIGHMSETPLSIRAHAAIVGEHNEYVYKELLGYSDGEYQWFENNQHAGTTFINEIREREE
jgi:crotonobetainyl-CoA:carnitine CoA-transferase CaiB-like acyl-CoA transferase